MVKSKRVQVSFTKRQWRMLEMLRGEMGDNDADIVRNIVLAWLAEKSFVTDTTKLKMDKMKTDQET
ncbi:MAG: CopG family transcriptional regulator [Candidatus Lokiarchaeota archaeon]|nr:CopG family transcriptional regulator [Candidatus Lokiarchaeota archaeon]